MKLNTMTLNFDFIKTNSSSNLNCSFCLEDIENHCSIAHEKGGEKHPIHLKCAQIIAENIELSKFCPTCRQPVLLNSFLKRNIFNVTWLGKNVLGSLSSGYFFSKFLLGNCKDINLLFAATYANSIYHLMFYNERKGSMVGGSIGMLFGFSMITLNHLELFPIEIEYLLLSSISTGMSLGAYIEKKFF